MDRASISQMAEVVDTLAKKYQNPRLSDKKPKSSRRPSIVPKVFSAIWRSKVNHRMISNLSKIERSPLHGAMIPHHNPEDTIERHRFLGKTTNKKRAWSKNESALKSKTFVQILDASHSSVTSKDSQNLSSLTQQMNINNTYIDTSMIEKQKEDLSLFPLTNYIKEINSTATEKIHNEETDKNKVCHTKTK